MRFTNQKGNTDTIRKVWSNDKGVCYGLVGTVGDFLTKKILTYADYPAETWVFIPALGSRHQTRFASTREDAVANLPQD